MKKSIRLLCSVGILIAAHVSFTEKANGAVPSTVIISPKDGDVWQVGSTQIVSWATISSLAPPEAFPQAEIQLLRKSPSDNQFWYLGRIATQSETGTYSWVIPNEMRKYPTSPLSDVYVEGALYKIIVNGPGAPYGISAPFTITAGTTTNPSITITSPWEGAILRDGRPYSFHWASKNLPEHTTIGIRIFNGVVAAGTNISEIPNKMIVSGLSATATSYTWIVKSNDGTWGAGSDYRTNVTGVRNSTYTVLVYAVNPADEVVAVTISSCFTITTPTWIEQIYNLPYVRCTFPTVEGTWYAQEYSMDLKRWTADHRFQADDNQVVFQLMQTTNAMFFRIRPLAPDTPILLK